MTTIKLKNGSGAPTSGDLAQGEPALDLTNKRLYTEDSGGTVIEVGTNPGASGAVTLNHSGSAKLTTTATGIDVTGTVTADGATIDGGVTVNGAGINLDNAYGLSWGDGSAQVRGSGSSEAVELLTSSVVRLNADADGDISFYNSAGTSQDLFWDASTSRLGLGETNPAHELHIKSASPQIRLEDSDGTNTYGDLQYSGVSLNVISRGGASTYGAITFARTDGTNTYNTAQINAVGDFRFYNDSGTAKMRWDASTSRLGIGTETPEHKLSVFEDSDGNRTEIGIDNTDQRLVLGAYFEAGVAQYATIQSTNNAETAAQNLLLQPDGGNLGIGTSEFTDSYKIIIEGSDQETADLTDAGTHGATLFLRATGEGIGSGGAVAFGTTFGNKRPFAAIKGHVLDGTANSAGALSFSTRASTSATALTERMRIDPSGNVGINNVNPDTSLHIGDISATNATGQGRIKLEDTSGSLANTGGLEFVTSAFGSGYGWKVNSIDAGGGVHLAFGTRQNSTTWSEKARLDTSGNLLVGGSATPASSQGNLALFNGVVPTGSVTDGIVLYAEDVSSSSELKVRDEAGNITTLSPHNFDLIPEGPSEDMAWAYFSEKDGKRINVDMLKAIRLLERISGEKLVFEN